MKLRLPYRLALRPRVAAAPRPSGPLIFRRVADGVRTRDVLPDGSVTAVGTGYSMGGQEPPSAGSAELRYDGEVGHG